jgi:hypothetical protein
MVRGAAWVVLGVGVGCLPSPPEPFWVGRYLSYGATSEREVCRGSWEVQERYVAEMVALLGAEPMAPIPYTRIELDEREHYCGREDIGGCAVDGEVAYSIHAVHLHELAHVLARRVGARGPWAIGEGFAEVFGDGLYSTTRRLPIEDVMADVEADRGGSYYTAGLFVRFLIEEYGLESLLEFMRRTDRDSDADEYGAAFQAVFGAPIADAYAAFEAYPGCPMRSNRVALFECAEAPVAWVEGTWQAASELDCDDPTVVGPVENNEHVFVLSNRGLEVARGGRYEVEVTGGVGGLAGARIHRCGSCWDEYDATIRVGQRGALDLEAGRYYVTLVREFAEVGDVRVTLSAPPGS